MAIAHRGKTCTQWLIARLKKWIHEEDSPSMVEYGLLLGFIALTASIGAAFLGKHLRNMLKDAVEMFEKFLE